MSRSRHGHEQFMQLLELQQAIYEVREARKYANYNWKGAEEYIAKAEASLREARRWGNVKLPIPKKPTTPLANITLQSWTV